MKNYFFIFCVPSLFFSSFAMDNGLSPAERRELLARAAEQRMRSQVSKSETTESTIPQTAAPVVQEEQPEGESDEHEIISMAERIKQDKEFTDSILINQKIDNAKVPSLKQLCTANLENLYIFCDQIGGQDYLEIDKLMSDLKALPLALGSEVRNNVLKSFYNDYLYLIPFPYEESYPYFFRALIERDLWNYKRNLLELSLARAIEILSHEAKLIFLTSSFKALSLKEKEKLKRTLVYSMKAIFPLKFKTDIVNDLFNFFSCKAKSLQELVLKTLIREVKIGFINIQKMLQLLDILEHDDCRRALMSLITKKIFVKTDNDKAASDVLNFLICYKLLKSIVYYYDVKAAIQHDFDKRQYDPFKYWNLEEFQQEVSHIFLSSYYKKLPYNFKRALEHQIKKFCLEKYGRRIHLAEYIFSNKFYSIIKKQVFRHGCKTSYALGAVGSLAGSVLTSQILRYLNASGKFSAKAELCLWLGTSIAWGFATIPTRWKYFFDDTDDHGLDHVYLGMASILGGLHGFTLGYFLTNL